MNANATSFTQIFNLDFDHNEQIASASVQVLFRELEGESPMSSRSMF
jgi:hypothetical protein